MCAHVCACVRACESIVSLSEVVGVRQLLCANMRVCFWLRHLCLFLCVFVSLRGDLRRIPGEAGTICSGGFHIYGGFIEGTRSRSGLQRHAL